MSRRLASVAVGFVFLVAGCGAGAGPTPVPVSNAPSPGATAGAVASQPAATQGGSTVAALPEPCATGFIAFLKLIEPDAARLNASSTLKDFRAIDEAVKEKGVQAMSNPATMYDCSSVGLQFAYFDSSSPWEAVLAVASKEAPGTAGYLSALRERRASDVRKMADYGASSCDDAVAKIKQRVKAAKAAGAADVGAMPVFDGIAVLGLYDTYLHEVQNDACPKDQLGNDEFDFFGAY
jgi:hypothetical protein